MTRVDFYILQNTDDRAKDLVVCRFVEKAFRLGHAIYMLTTDREQSARLDDLLWTFSPGSFIPHEICTSSDAAAVRASPQVLIGHADPPDNLQDVLVTLCREVPTCFSRFQRIAEFIGASDAEKQYGRDRYRFYRDRGYPLEDHSV